ncbi:MAG: deoxyribose-phosphate aldolase [bacterium JZ-2024 1]
MPHNYSRLSVAPLIDFTFLDARAPEPEFQKFLLRASEFPFACLIVPPFRVAQAARFLDARQSHVPVGTVISFPLGFESSREKLNQIKEAVSEGAREVDVVHNISLYRSDLAAYNAEIQELVKYAHSLSVVIKVILETSALTDQEIMRCTDVIANAGADFVKTSTGLFGNPTPEVVRLISQVSAGRARVKASGGIRSLKDLITFVSAGAERIGTSSGHAILMECAP